MGYGTQKPPVGSQVNRGHPLAQGLVAAWTMNEAAGGIVADCFGQNHGAVNGSVPWYPGTTGTALRYTASASNFVNVPAVAQLDLRSSFTIATRIFINASTTSAWIEKTVGGTVNTQFAMFSSFLGAGLRSFTLRGQPSNTDAASSSYPDALWYDVVGTYDNVTLRVYVNGKADGTAAKAGPISGGSGVTLIGKLQGFFPFSGMIEYLYISSKTLRPPEIAWLYAEPYAMFKPVRRRTYSVSGSTIFGRGTSGTDRAGSREAA